MHRAQWVQVCCGSLASVLYCFLFFFQAEDGIRDLIVTGVQTCALPILRNLTEQVRSTAQVTTAVAKGDLSQTIDVDAVGEFLELKDTINTMVEQLATFAEDRKSVV